MRTELPAERMRRRLSGESGADEEPDTDDENDTSLSRWLPDGTGSGATSWLAAIRADPGRAGVVALGVVGLLAVLVTVYTLAGKGEPKVVAANLPAVQPVSSTGPASAASSAAPPPADAPVVVSVVGLVRAPGLVTLGPGARIADALKAAGGAFERADTTGLNMARKVADGEQIVVGIASLPGAPPVMGSSISAGHPDGAAPQGPSAPPPTAKPGAPLDLNSASVEQLDGLPGVGPVTASAIVAWRDANGRFASIDQLGEVDGIGPARLDKLRNLVHV